MSLIFLATNNEFLSLSTKFSHAAAGGQVVFTGGVRGVNHGQEVSHLFYEAHEKLAVQVFNDLEGAARERFHIKQSAAFHRLGRVEVGDQAVLIAVSADHRHEAFLAARFLIDELKRSAPIWKKEVYKNGTSSWGEPCAENASLEGKIRPVVKALEAKGVLAETLKNKRILLVGAGGLGCPLAINLMGLNLKKITIYDGDRVSSSNLLRQFIYRENDSGAKKASVIGQFLLERHRECDIDARPVFLTRAEAECIAHQFDLIIDATDSISTKTMLKEIAWAQGVCLISSSVHQWQGEVQSFSPKLGACLSCFSPTDHTFRDGACEDRGVLTHVCALVAAVATEKALGLLCGHVTPCEITLIDPGGFIKSVLIEKDRYCRVCGEHRRYAQKKLVRLMR